MAIRDTVRNMFRSNKVINQNLKLLKKGVQDVYHQTYFSLKDDDYEKNVKDEIESHANSIRNLMASDGTNSVSNMSKLLTRLGNNAFRIDDKTLDGIQAFNDPIVQQGLLTTFTESIYIKAQDQEIDNILHYVPKLHEALKIKKDCVLAADHYGRDFLSFMNVVGEQPSDVGVFRQNMKNLYKKFDIAKKADDLLMDIQKYGEQFIYIIPYKTAFERLFKNKPTSIRVFQEAVNKIEAKDKAIVEIINKDTMLSEGAFSADILNKRYTAEQFSSECKDVLSGVDVTVEISDGLCIESVIEQYTRSAIIKEKNNIVSLSEAFSKRADENTSTLNEDSLEMPEHINSVLMGADNTDNDNTKINMPGAIMKILDREKVFPFYIEDCCLMYFYFEIIGPESVLGMNGNTPLMNTTIPSTSKATGIYDNQDKISAQKDLVMGYISGMISKMIDKKFVNSNQDLRKEIYMILKNNDILNSSPNGITGNIRISCIPADDIIHAKFNTNQKTHRGISDLAYSIYPATLWSYLTSSIVNGALTRGQDKRIYYIKQSIDTNVAATMLNTINQLKRGNFGIRQIENINNMFGIIGRYNDIMMPLTSSGDQPIQIDVMKGQDIDPMTELRDGLLEIAVNLTDIPIDFTTNSTQVEYAIKASMTNARVARGSMNRGDMYSEILSLIVTKLYDYEYEDNIEVEVNLPEPLFLKSNNDAQTYQAVANEVDTLVAAYYPQELTNKDENLALEAAAFRKVVLQNRLKRHISETQLEEYIKKAKELITEKDPIKLGKDNEE